MLIFPLKLKLELTGIKLSNNSLYLVKIRETDDIKG